MASLGEGTSVGEDEAYVGVADAQGLTEGREPVPACGAGGGGGAAIIGGTIVRGGNGT